MASGRDFLPAAGRARLAALYDPVVALTLREPLTRFGPTRDHVAGRLPGLIEAAGFEPPSVRRRLRTAFGTVELIEARAS